MKIVKIDGGFSSSDSYLVTINAEKSILIDPGTNSKKLIDEIENHNLKLEFIILTHCHYDHVAAAEEIKNKKGGKIAVHKKDAQALERGDQNKTVSSSFDGTLKSIDIDIYLKDGETIGPLEVIHTPGHTEGSICLYNSKNKVMFTGDTVFPGGRHGRTDMPSGSVKDMANSLKKLSDYDINKIYTGHGGIGTGEDIDRAL